MPPYPPDVQAALTTAVYTAWPRLTPRQKHLLGPLLTEWAHGAPPDPPLPKPEPGEMYPGQMDLWRAILKAAGAQDYNAPRGRAQDAE